MGTYSVCIASRGRHNALIAVIVSMWRLRSGKNEIRFVVGLDEDDMLSIGAAAELLDEGLPVVVSVGTRSASLGAAYNRCISAADADAYMMTSDRAFIVTPGWDEQLRLDVEAHPGRVLWLTSADPDPTHPVIPASMLAHLGGKWSQEIFPFWWDDTWLAEIEYLVHGNIVKVPVEYAGERGKTNRLRDVAFWHSVFERTRPLRIRAALAMTYIPTLALAERVDKLRAMSSGIGERADELEAQFGDTSPATLEYIEAKARAEGLVADLDGGCAMSDAWGGVR